MQYLRSIVFDVFLYGLILVLGIVFAPFALWSRDGAYFACRTYCRMVLWLLRTLCGLSTEIRGAVPAGSVIVASKHQSFLDILMLFNALPRAKFVMKRELRFVPIFGFYAMRLGSTPVARGKRSAAMKAMVEHVEADASEADQIVIYPQGTRVAPGAYLPYKVGAGVLYQRLGRVCVPAATNVGVFWGRRALLKRPGVAVLEFLPPMPAGLPIAQFMAELEAAVERESDRLMREAGFAPERSARAEGA